MKIKIISDSTCDLPRETLAKYDISVAPLNVVKNGETFQDGITITPEIIFSHVADGGELCTTSACNIDQYLRLFGTFSPEYDGIIHISLGSAFSSSYQNACIAAEDFPNVRVVDSMNLSGGQGLVTLKACELASSGRSLDDIVTELHDYTAKVETSFILDRLDYMVKGGRCSMVAMLGANLLRLKPCIEVKDGKMVVVKKYRGHYESCIKSDIHERLANRDDIDSSNIIVVSTDVPEECHRIVIDGIAENREFEQTFSSTAGCTISCHCGPGTLGIIFARK